MSRNTKSGAPQAKRYSPEEKARAVRLVRQLRKELGTSHGTIKRVGLVPVGWTRSCCIRGGRSRSCTLLDEQLFVFDRSAILDRGMTSTMVIADQPSGRGQA